MAICDFPKSAGFLKSRSASAALEFALVAPVLLMIAIGILMFGLYFGSLIAVTNAAAEGARASIAGLNDSERGVLATQAASTTFASYAPFLMQSYMTVNTKADPNNSQRFLVSVTYDFGSFDFLRVSSLVPVPVQKPTVTISVADAGYY